MEQCIKCGEYMTEHEHVVGTDLCKFCYCEEMKQMEETLETVKKEMQ